MLYIKQFLSVIITIFITISLQACGGSSTKNTVVKEPIDVHLIKPSDIAAYIEEFKQQQTQLELQFEGKQYQISLFDISFDNNLIIAKYELGYIAIGFDFSTEQPIASLRFIEGEIEGEAQPDRILDGTNIEVEEQENNYIYSGSVIETTTQNMFSVRLVINSSILEGGTSTIEVIEDMAFINGDLGTSTYIQISDLIQNHPEVKTLVLQQISGSINDAINMHTGRLVRSAQLTTIIPAGGDVNSGGVDLFAAGFERKYEQGGKVGVHSWCCVGGKPADKLSKEDSAHDAQLTYFRDILGKELGPEFYFFTLDAASFETVHVMNQAELEQYLISK